MKEEKDKKVPFLNGKEFTDKCRLGNYEPPRITKTEVETEGGFCVSEEIKNVTPTNDAVEVDEYISIENNEITFD